MLHETMTFGISSCAWQSKSRQFIMLRRAYNIQQGKRHAHTEREHSFEAEMHFDSVACWGEFAGGGRRSKLREYLNRKYLRDFQVGPIHQRNNVDKSFFGQYQIAAITKKPHTRDKWRLLGHVLPPGRNACASKAVHKFSS